MISHPAKREYAARARIGIATPQANPTVEPEIACLLPPRIGMLVTRLTSRAASARQRLLDYIETLDKALDSFDTLALDAFGFACTGSSYLLGIENEQARIGQAAKERGHPIISAAQAIRWSLRQRRAQRIAIIAPYPGWLRDAAVIYWQAAGFEVIACETVAIGSSDTRAIYELSGEAAIAAAKTLAGDNPDCILLSGTGMPTLSALNHIETATGIPTLSSNYCLAWALLDRIGATEQNRIPPGWQDRLLHF